MNKTNHSAADEVADMLRGIPPKRILLSFGDEPAKPLDEHLREQQNRRATQRKTQKETD